jgi:hypothetical protein
MTPVLCIKKEEENVGSQWDKKKAPDLSEAVMTNSHR